MPTDINQLENTKQGYLIITTVAILQCTPRSTRQLETRATIAVGLNCKWQGRCLFLLATIQQLRVFFLLVSCRCGDGRPRPHDADPREFHASNQHRLLLSGRCRTKHDSPTINYLHNLTARRRYSYRKNQQKRRSTARLARARQLFSLKDPNSRNSESNTSVHHVPPISIGMARRGRDVSGWS
jgi:hypothetical protein